MKKLIGILCALLLLLPVVPAAAADAVYYVTPEDFSAHLGSWTIQKYNDAYNMQVLQGRPDGAKDQVDPAVMTLDIPEDGTYQVYARTRDFEATPAKRLFELELGGTKLEKTLGGHGKEGFQWEKAGTVDLKKGMNTLKVLDVTAEYGRFDLIVLTKAASPNLPESIGEVEKELASWTHLAASASGTAEQTNQPGQTGPSAEGLRISYLLPEDFAQSLGTWSVQKYNEAYQETVLQGAVDGNTAKVQPAAISFELQEEGDYTLYVRTRDFVSGAGSRVFKLQVNDTKLDKKLGGHGVEAFQWEEAGTVHLAKGENLLAVHDISAVFPRFDMIAFAKEAGAVFPQTLDALNAQVTGWTHLSAKPAELVVKEEIPPLKDAGTADWGIHAGRTDAFGIKVFVNGSQVTFADQQPFLNEETNRTLVPMRGIFEKVGMEVSWDEGAQKVTAQKAGAVIELIVGSDKALINGEETVLDQPAITVNDRTLVPLRFVGEALGGTVGWDEQAQTVEIQLNR